MLLLVVPISLLALFVQVVTIALRGLLLTLAVPRELTAPQVCDHFPFFSLLRKVLFLGSSNTTVCPTGYYCPATIANPVLCPASYYCPSGSSAPIRCYYGSYCPAGTSFPVPCPLGYRAVQAPNDTLSVLGSLGSGCEPCPAGEYGIDPDRLECKTGLPGYYYLGGTNKERPTNETTDKGGVCPVGHYCPGKFSFLY